MYGQKELLVKIEKLLESEIPHLILLVGDNSEKLDIYKHISKGIDSRLSLCDVGVDEVREVISNSYKVKDKIVYVFEDAERMSMYAQNALLKITEEPPTNCYFIISFKNKEQILSTIKSRGFLLEMDKYSEDELRSYLESKYSYDSDLSSKIVNIVTTPNQIDVISKYDMNAFFELVQKVVNFLPSASLANALKISQSVKLKDEGEGYDLDIFLRCLSYEYSKCDRTNPYSVSRTCETLKVISTALHTLENSKYSKQSVLDSVILGVHRLWNY